MEIDLDELERRQIKQKVLADISNICCIYGTVGQALWDEPRERLAGRIASWVSEIEAENKRLRADVDRLGSENRDLEVENLQLVNLNNGLREQCDRLINKSQSSG